MNAKCAARDFRKEIGLCVDCRFGTRQDSARGSAFWRCQRAESEPAFERYPRLPVVRCPGFEPDPDPEPGGDPGAGASHG